MNTEVKFRDTDLDMDPIEIQGVSAGMTGMSADANPYTDPVEHSVWERGRKNGAAVRAGAGSQPARTNQGVQAPPPPDQ